MKMRSFLTWPLVCTTLWVSLCNAHADFKTDLAQVYPLYKGGAYTQAIDKLTKLQGDKTTPQDTQGVIAYWTGLCHSRMQAFDLAQAQFEKARDLGADFEDLDYELGQAQYAAQALKPARESFKRSVARKFKVGASTYYIGFLSQLLEDWMGAYAAYGSILKLSDDVDGVKQNALLQIGELKFAEAEKIGDQESVAAQKKSKIENEVIPAFKRVVAFKDGTPAAKQASDRIAQLTPSDERGNVPTYRNGVPMPAKPWVIKVGEDIKYDTNVIAEGEQATPKVSNKASVISATALFLKYEWIFDRQFAVSPELASNLTWHANRAEAQVYQNDNLNTTPAIKSRWEYKLGDMQAATLLDAEFNLMLRDTSRLHTLKYYSRAYNFALGQRARFFSFGNTTLTANYKFYGNQDSNQNSEDLGITLGQNFSLPRGLGITVQVGADFNRAVASTYDRNNYMLTSYLNLPDLLWDVDLGAGLLILITDTMENRSSRGWEKMLAPSITLSNTFFKRLGVSLSYAYTYNFSADQVTYAYTKHVVSLGTNYRF